MSSPPDPGALPSLQEAILDTEMLARLLSDIEGLTQVDEVLLKGGSTTMAATQHLSLTQAVEALQCGQAQGIQVRYRYQGGRWWDTLLRSPQGIRLVRIGHDVDVVGLG